MSGAPPALRLVNICRTFEVGGEVVRALHDVSFTVPKGSFIAVMGTSGSGKSTLMNILGLLDKPSQGTFYLMGEDVAGYSDNERAQMRGKTLGFVFQNFNLLPRTSAVDNVALPLVYRGVGRQERRRRALEALHKVRLGHRAEHTPQELSGGQQQRVAIARALVGQPHILFADEPTGNLDGATTDAVLALLAELHQEGLTVVMVTHEPDVARHAQRLLTFKDGALVGDGPPQGDGP